MTLINIVSVYSQSQRERLLNGLSENNATEFFPILEAVDWTPEAIVSFKDSILSKPQLHVCLSDVALSKLCTCTLVGHSLWVITPTIMYNYNVISIDLGGTYIWPGDYTQIRVSI